MANGLLPVGLRVVCLSLTLSVAASGSLLSTVQEARGVPIVPGDLLVADFTAGLILVDPRIGSQTLVSAGSAGDVGVARNGDIFKTSAGGLGGGGLFQVSPTGARTRLTQQDVRQALETFADDGDGKKDSDPSPQGNEISGRQSPRNHRGGPDGSRTRVWSR